MKIKLARYIIDNFSRLMSEQESTAINHLYYTTELEEIRKIYSLETYESRKKMFIKLNAFTSDPDVISLVNQGYENLVLNIGARILNERANEVFINRCPKCNSITRKPYSRQCSQCFAKWHDIVRATVKVKDVIKLSGPRPLFLMTEIKNGQLSIGDLLDFTAYQINLLAPILQVEYALISNNNGRTEYPCLGIDVTKNQEELIINYVVSSRLEAQVISGKAFDTGPNY